MEYPYIANNNLMFYAKDTATVVGDKDNLNTHGFKVTADECNYKNITRKYLEGKCVKIESPEHSEFVQKLAFNTGFKWKSTGNHEYLPVKDGYIHFRSEGMLRNYTTSFSELSEIPLPPKAEPEYHVFKDCEPKRFEPKIPETPKHFDCVCAKCGGKCCAGNCQPKEWPQVGDEVLFRNDLCKVLLMEDASRHIVVECNGNYVNPHIEDVKKPKTEAEILRDELIDAMDNSTTAFIYAEHIAKHLIDKYNITKKPQ